MIFFPAGHEPGFKAGIPAIVYIIDQVGDEYKGASTDTESLLGRFTYYPVRRTFAFNQTLWDLCLIHIQKRNQLEEEYKALQKHGKTYNQVAFEIPQ